MAGSGMRWRFEVSHGFAVIDMVCTTREQDHRREARTDAAQQCPPKRVSESAVISLDGHCYRFETEH